MLNEITLQGRLVKEPELRTTQSGTSMSSFTIAVARNFKDKTTGETKSDFINCIAYSKTADFIQRYFQKGSGILATGELQNDNFTDKNGVKHYSYTVVVNKVNFEIGGKNSDNMQAPPPQPQPQQDGNTDSFKYLDDLGNFDDIISDVVSDGNVPF